jgi:hypothetical protein
VIPMGISTVKRVMGNRKFTSSLSCVESKSWKRAEVSEV